MRYEGSVYRPPSEADSLIIQATIGCSHNQCSFCGMYKQKSFRIRPVADICGDLKEAARYSREWDRVFLADGDALMMPAEALLQILATIRETFPRCRRVGIYGSPQSILRKTQDELKALREAGLGIIYLGVESGNDEVLQSIRKGADREEMAQAGKRVKASGILLSVMLISGIGGRRRSHRHAVDSASLVELMNPDYLSLLTLMVEPGTLLKRQIDAGEFELLSPEEVLEETQLFLEHLNGIQTVFRSNHASNYLNLRGDLPQDRERMLRSIEKALADTGVLKAEAWRRL